MDNKNDKDVFSYTYSAKQKSEIEKIRKKYVTDADTAEDKLQTLKKLDASVTVKGTVVSLILGIMGCLLLGIGMCIAMLWSEVGDVSFILGIAVGLVGILLMCIAYPMYSFITQKQRERIAPEILSITDELLK